MNHDVSIHESWQTKDFSQEPLLTVDSDDEDTAMLKQQIFEL